MNLKCIKSEWWMESEWSLLEKTVDLNLKEITPIFNRNGIYKFGDNCWMESFGRAFEYSSDEFDKKFRRSSLVPISSSQYNLLNVWDVSGIDSRVSELLKDYSDRYSERLTKYRNYKELFC